MKLLKRRNRPKILAIIDNREKNTLDIVYLYESEFYIKYKIQSNVSFSKGSNRSNINVIILREKPAYSKYKNLKLIRKWKKI